ncbi:hypothetical protein OC844_004324 [Tilletia horrida]|nr:hypothetical protein OC844_004324 [Tilletia horrida]
MAPPPLRPYPYTLTHQTRWPDADVYAHVYNGNYYVLADSAINVYLIAHCGLQPSSTSRDAPIGLMIASSAQFFAPLHFPSRVVTGLCVRKIGTSSVLYEIGLWEEGKAELAAVVRATHVFVDRETRVPLGKGGDGRRGLPREMREGLEKILIQEEDGEGDGNGNGNAKRDSKL